MTARPGRLLSIPRSGTGAANLLGSATNGMAIDFVDGTMEIRDVATPANNFVGLYSAKLTIVGSLPSGGDGPVFDTANYASLALTAFPFNAATGTFFFEANTTLAPTGNQNVFSCHDGTASELIMGRFLSAPNIRAVVTDGGVAQANFGANAPVPDVHASFAMSYQLNNISASFNRGTSAADTLATIPTVTTLHLGIRGYSVAEGLAGRIRRFLYVPTAYTGVNLQAGPPGWA